MVSSTILFLAELSKLLIKTIIIKDIMNEKNLIFLKSLIMIIIYIAAKVLKKKDALSPLKKIKTSIDTKILGIMVIMLKEKIPTVLLYMEDLILPLIQEV